MNRPSHPAGGAPVDLRNVRDIVTQLIHNGYKPVPCTGKRVLVTGWTQLDFAEQDFEPNHNVGIKTGDGIAMVDIDIMDPAVSAAVVAEFLRRHPEAGRLQRTGMAPKTSFLVASDLQTKIEARLPDVGKKDKFEVLARGQQFVAFGIHPDTREPYVWHGLDPRDPLLGAAEMLPFVSAADLTDFRDWVAGTYGPKADKSKVSEQAAKAAGSKFEPSCSSGGFFRGVNEAALQYLDLWVPALLPAAKKQATGAWRVTSRDLGRDLEEDLSIHPDGVQDFGLEAARTPIDLVIEFGGAPDAPAAAKWLCDKIGCSPETLGWSERKRKPDNSKGPVSKLRAESTTLDLVTDDRRRPIWNTANAIAILAGHPDWKGVFGFNEFTRRRVVLGVIPGTNGGKLPRSLEDDDIVAVLSWFNRNGFPRATASVAVGAVHAVCRFQSFDPLRDFLEELEWDGQQRIGSWLTNYCGVDASPYTAEVGRRWLISAVARAMMPGCKADHMLVLEGDQGARKSTALAALAGDAWFTDALPPMNTKDASDFLRGRWIVEVAELEAMRREMDAVKAFLSRQVESFRPAYGRETVDEPRRCIFAGTTNKDTWLKDETGGRRFWPVKVGQIDVAGLERDRAQLWAEAVAAFKAGERWWLEGEVEAEAREQQSQRQIDDPWTGDVLRLVAGLREVCIPDVLNGLGKKPEDRTRADSDRVADVLKRNGWRRDGKFTRGERKGQARFISPD